jgi:Rha family phage regulatory protein
MYGILSLSSKKLDGRVNRINKLKKSTIPTERTFTLSEYTDNTGRNLPYYLMDKDGFALLVMGFTGEKAHLFKIEYIKAFNNAIQTIQDQQDQLMVQQGLLLEQAKAQNKLFKIDTALEKFGELSENNGYPRTKPVSYLRGERKQKVYLADTDLGCFKQLTINFD